jgi:outer membrane protein OmpA-like peptidoglycan-associated protein
VVGLERRKRSVESPARAALATVCVRRRIDNNGAPQLRNIEVPMNQRTFPVAVVVAVSLLIGACQTTNPYTGEQKTSNTAKGAGVGAAAGALLGMLVGGKSRESALIGAGVGALAGGAVGKYMDNEEAKLRQQLQGTGVSVTRYGDNLILNMPGNVTFATNQSDVKADFYPTLNSVALVLKEYDKTLVDVVGATDSTGSPQHNMDLSLRRANSVAQYLQSQGVSPMRLQAQGIGPKDPIASNDTAEGRQANRRVELVLRPLTA